VAVSIGAGQKTRRIIAALADFKQLANQSGEFGVHTRFFLFFIGELLEIARRDVTSI
jgi:hypothetical protein